MKTADIRSRFLEFFRERGHTVVPSAPLVPANDPTLMFTVAGMVQFKNVFLGSEKPGYVRAVDVQRCLRAGGKHNDLDAVGYTARHHTFFEMLGNWSFGDYFKREAIGWSWELLTDVFGLEADKLWVTVYETDDEAYDLWRETIGVPAERIVRIGDNGGAPYASDNFWAMGDTGPCGPCTEIFYDHGADVAGGPPGSLEADGDRYVEIWNLVFMQFDRQVDGSLQPLPAPCVDTGMGLERLAAVLQGVHSNYEIDLFQRLITAAAELTGCNDTQNASLRVIADHIRACAFLLIDGVTPSNEGRGYVLRRIIRRALRHGWMLGVRGDFFWKMAAPLLAEMGEAYPELVRGRESLEAALRGEELRFGETLEQGMKVFDTVAAQGGDTIAGEDAFRLYDTYGFPVDLTADMARERGMSVDMQGFDAAMDVQRQRARAASQFEAKAQLSTDLVSTLPATEFGGYHALSGEGASVLAIVRDGREITQLGDDEEATVILDHTPFYAESGGQVGDTGTLDTDAGTFKVSDTQKLSGAFHGHVGRWRGGRPLKVGEGVRAMVDGARRQATVLNHSATHLLHAALRRILGEHVTQKGSLVAPDRLRFDFSHPQPLTSDELHRIESLVNAQIRRNLISDIREMGYDEAIDAGAMALFGEKYGDRVRVLSMGDFSTELCGGTHVRRSGDIGLFKIVAESGVAAGVRRIEAVTGEGALAFVGDEERRLAEVAQLLSSSGADVADKLRQVFGRHRKLERELESLKARAASSASADLASQARDVDGIKVVASRMDGLEAKGLRDSVDQLKQRLGDCVVLLASAQAGKAALVAGVHGAALQHIRAGDVVADVARRIGGKGGGRADMAQGGGTDSPALDEALRNLPQWLERKLSEREQ